MYFKDLNLTISSKGPVEGPAKYYLKILVANVNIAHRISQYSFLPGIQSTKPPPPPPPLLWWSEIGQVGSPCADRRLDVLSVCEKIMSDSGQGAHRHWQGQLGDKVCDRTHHNRRYAPAGLVSVGGRGDLEPHRSMPSVRARRAEQCPARSHRPGKHDSSGPAHADGRPLVHLRSAAPGPPGRCPARMRAQLEHRRHELP